jgi:hypothetical protein
LLDQSFQLYIVPVPEHAAAQKNIRGLRYDPLPMLVVGVDGLMVDGVLASNVDEVCVRRLIRLHQCAQQRRQHRRSPP